MAVDSAGLERQGPDRRARVVLLGVLVAISGILTALFRFATIPGFSNDHFVHLAAAQQMLFGDLPTRDFIDIGRPLQIAVSAAAQAAGGHTLFAEAVLVSAAFGVAAALTAAIVFKVTDSPVISLGAVAFEAIAFPRTYAYPKPLATAIGLWLIACFVYRPGLRRQLAMAAGVTIAFLLRHDLGLFVGTGALVASVLAVPRPSGRNRLRSALTFAALVTVMVAPYLAYVQLTEGLWNYLVTAWDQNQTEAGYIWPNPFVSGAPPESRLVYLFHLLPVVAMALCVKDWKGSRPYRWETSFMAAAAVLAVAANIGLIRDLLEVRVRDAVVPAVVLGAWLVHRAWLSRPPYMLIPAAVVLAGAISAIVNLGDGMRETMNRAGITSENWWHSEAWRARFAERYMTLHERFGDAPASRAAEALTPFIFYLERCTNEQHRLFLGGFMPEVAYYARRAFAGGGYEHYNFNSPTNQQRVVDRMRRQLVPFVVIPAADDETLAVDLPIIEDYFRERYVPLTDVLVHEDQSVRILVDQNLKPTSRDAETGWPCFT